MFVNFRGDTLCARAGPRNTISCERTKENRDRHRPTHPPRRPTHPSPDRHRRDSRKQITRLREPTPEIQDFGRAVYATPASRLRRNDRFSRSTLAFFRGTFLALLKKKYVLCFSRLHEVRETFAWFIRTGFRAFAERKAAVRSAVKARKKLLRRDDIHRELRGAFTSSRSSRNPTENF